MLLLLSLDYDHRQKSNFFETYLMPPPADPNVSYRYFVDKGEGWENARRGGTGDDKPP
jgi:hypothetical protein